MVKANLLGYVLNDVAPKNGIMATYMDSGYGTVMIIRANNYQGI